MILSEIQPTQGSTVALKKTVAQLFTYFDHDGNAIIEQLKHPPPTNQPHSPLPLLKTDHPQKQGSDSMENQGISKDLSNSVMVVGPNTTPAAANVAAETLEDPPHTYQARGPLNL